MGIPCMTAIGLEPVAVRIQAVPVIVAGVDQSPKARASSRTPKVGLYQSTNLNGALA